MNGKNFAAIIVALPFVCFFALIASCASNPKTTPVDYSFVNNAGPVDEQVRILVNGTIRLTAIDGLAVFDAREAVGADGNGRLDATWGNRIVYLLLPGEYSIEGNYTVLRMVTESVQGSSGAYYRVDRHIPAGSKDFAISYNLRPGQFYYLWGADADGSPLRSATGIPGSIKIWTPEEFSEDDYWRKNREAVEGQINSRD